MFRGLMVYQTEFAESVLRWQAFHTNLSDGSSNKVSLKNQGIALLSHLYGRARDLCKPISDEVINTENGVEVIVAVIHKRDPLSVVSSVYSELIKLMTVKRLSNKTFKDFELRFDAQLSRFNSLATNTALSNPLSALILLANANVDAGQRVSIIAAASPPANLVDSNASIDKIILLVIYESVAPVLRQRDGQKNGGSSARIIAASTAQVQFEGTHSH